ncbi:MAG: ParA family protein [Myxococcota bacterium]
MKSIAVASPKGGVGKTTVALQLAHALVKRHHRALLVDGDPQGAIGLSLSPKLNAVPGFSAFIAEGRPLAEVVVPTRVDGFALLPVGRIGPYETEAFGAALASGERLRRLVDEAAADYDVVLFDTPSGFGGITTGVLRAVSYAVSPLQAEPVALRALTQLLEMVQVLRQEGAAVRLVGLIVTMLQVRNEHSFDVARELLDQFPPDLLFSANVPRDPVFLEATAKGVPVGLLRRPAPPVTHVFDLIAAELEERMGLVEQARSDEPQPFLV